MAEGNPRVNDDGLLEAAGHETREKIEALRKKLLDLSRANPLINIRLSSASTSSVIRIVDELPEIVAFELTNGGMTLQPLPALHAERKDERTAEFRQLMVELRATNPAYLAELDRIEAALEGTLAEEATVRAENALRSLARSQLGLPTLVAAADFSLAAHARSHGVEPSYLLPESSGLKPTHEDTLLQTLLLPEKLDRIGKNLEARHRAVQRETGMSVLHAVFGILEWAHPEDQISLGPLLLQGLDVHVDKSPQGHIIQLVAENAPFTNQTLVQKLADARGLDLPCIRDGQQIEDYFREITGLAPEGWTWKVRREVVIALLPSARMAMWNDLDPAESDIILQPKIQSLLATSSGTLQSYASDHETDHPDAARKVPCVILDADASQLSVLIDAADGKDMSIEGPPGSGKSQTIVNLIAAAMHAGKTVLFVAEKLTALDVVKNRLEVAGLGDFLLTLQPGQSSAEQIYESIERRFAMRPSMHAARSFYETGTNLARRREALSRYVAAIAAPLGATGLTVHEVIGHAIAGGETRRRMPPELRRLALPQVEALSPSDVEEIRSSTRALADRIDPSRAMAEVWINSSAPVHAVEEAEDLCVDITVMLGAAEDAASLLKTSPWGSLAYTSPLAIETEIHLELLSRIASATPAARALVPALAHPEDRQQAADHSDDIRLSTELTIWRDDTFENPASPDLTSHVEMLLRILAVEREISVTKAAARVQQLQDGLAVLRGTQEAISTFPQDLRPSGTSLRDIQDATRQILACPNAALAAREVLDPETLRREADSLDRKRTELMEEVRRRASVPLDSLPDRSEIQNAADIVSSTGLLGRMGSSYKAALALGLRITPERGRRQAVAAALTALTTTLNRIAALTGC